MGKKSKQALQCQVSTKTGKLTLSMASLTQGWAKASTYENKKEEV